MLGDTIGSHKPKSRTTYRVLNTEKRDGPTKLNGQ